MQMRRGGAKLGNEHTSEEEHDIEKKFSRQSGRYMAGGYKGDGCDREGRR